MQIIPIKFLPRLHCYATVNMLYNILVLYISAPVDAPSYTLRVYKQCVYISDLTEPKVTNGKITRYEVINWQCL